MKKKSSRQFSGKPKDPDMTFSNERPRGIKYVAFYEFIIGILNIFLPKGIKLNLLWQLYRLPTCRVKVGLL